jgi:predicted protein tyrosine phosphatase
MKFIVRSQTLMKSLDLDEPYAVISITDPMEQFVVPKRWGLTDTLYLKFFDFDPDKEKEAGRILADHYTNRCMSEGDADRVAEFVSDNAHLGCLVVHCYAGASRSPSIAMALCDHLHLPRNQIDWGGLPTNVLAPNEWVYDRTREAMVRRQKRVA